MPIVYTSAEVEVDVSLSDFDTDDLCDEVESRGLVVIDKTELVPNLAPEVTELLEKLHNAYILKQVDQIEPLIRELFYTGLGRII